MEKEGGVKYSITKEVQFAAAHKLEWHEGKCKFLHGHGYVVAVTVSRKDGGLDKNGIVYDLGHLGAEMKEIADSLDHSYLNDTFENPTAERIANFFLDCITGFLGVLNGNVIVTKVVVEESPGSSVTLEC